MSSLSSYNVNQSTRNNHNNKIRIQIKRDNFKMGNIKDDGEGLNDI